MKRFLIFLAVLLISASTICAEYKKLTPARCGTGTYGYRQADGEWSFMPLYSYAGPMVNDYAAVSFDGIHYGLMNCYHSLITELSFLGVPSSFYKGAILVRTQNNRGYIADITGKACTPEVEGLRLEDGMLFGIDSVSHNAAILDGTLRPLSTSRHGINKISRVRIGGEIGDSLYKADIYIGIGSYSLAFDAYDADGNNFFPDHLYQILPLSDSSFNYAGDWEKAFEKNGLKSSAYRGLFFTARNSRNDKYGVYFIDGEEISVPKHDTPQKAAKAFLKDFKKKVMPRLTSGELTGIAVSRITELNETAHRAVERNMAQLGIDPDSKIDILATKYTLVTVEDVKGKTAGAKSKKGKKKGAAPRTVGRHFVNPDNPAGGISTEVYDEIIDNSIYFICRKKGEKKYHLHNYLGIQVTVDPYDEIVTCGYNKDEELIFRVRNGKEWGLINIVGRELISPQFSEIGIFHEDPTVMAVRDGKYYLINTTTGRLLNGIAYDEMDGYSLHGKTRVKRLGYETTIDENGVESPSIPEVAFNEAYNWTGSTEDKLTAYAKCIELCSASDKKVLGAAYCNIGVIYEEAGDYDNAKMFYERSKNCGSNQGASNYSTLVNRERSQRAQNVSNFFSVLAEGLSQFGGGNSAFDGFVSGLNGNSDFGNSYSGTGYSDGDRSDNTAYSTGKRNVDASTYQNIYDRWEREAKAQYEALTRGGTRTSKGGQATSGTSDGYWRHHYSELKRLLRNAQSEMRKTRHEAQRAGVTIRQSNYETVSVTN